MMRGNLIIFILGMVLGMLLIPNTWVHAYESDTTRPSQRGPNQRKFFLSSYIDYSRAAINGNNQDWLVSTTRFAYLFKNLQLPYVEVSYYKRDERQDYTINLGGYYAFKNRSYLHVEVGYGADADFVYQWKVLQEYNFPIWKNLFFKQAYRFLKFANEDIHTISPGLTFYFSDHYVAAQYNPSIVTGRGLSHNGQITLSFRLAERVNVKAGAVIGERVYDVVGTTVPSEAFGFLTFGALDIGVREYLTFTFWGYYGRERPNFSNPGVGFGISLEI